ncbi:recombination-associated protein RdgC [Dyella sp. 2RAB6]|uniref:recombination-associated protein RdgC n=1 Tax=Dyella sp. 2RAB6 TaxID=3232992 RepID=UPI003F93CA15
MFPRNLSLFRFGASPSNDIAADLARHRVREPGPHDLATRGFGSPYGLVDDRLTIVANGCTGFVFVQAERVLPAASVRDAVTKKVQAIATEEGRKVGRKERKQLHEDVLQVMLPHAPVTSRRIAGWIDPKHGWLVIDTPSRRYAELALSALREAFGSFPAVPLSSAEAPRALLTDWLANDSLPSSLSLGDECELRDPVTATGALVRCRRQALGADEIKEHLRGGKQAFQVGLVFDDRLSLVLSHDLAITRLRPLDVLTADQAEAESHDMQVESDMALATLEVRRLLAFIETTFTLARPAEA